MPEANRGYSPSVRRGPANNPVGVVRHVDVSDEAFSAIVAFQEPLSPPAYPATLWSLVAPRRRIAELHRLIDASPNRTVLTYRTRRRAVVDCGDIPKVGDEGELIQWWLPEVVELVMTPNPPPKRVSSSAVRADHCLSCWKDLPNESLAWKRGAVVICEDCRERYVEQDQLGLRTARR